MDLQTDKPTLLLSIAMHKNIPLGFIDNNSSNHVVNLYNCNMVHHESYSISNSTTDKTI